jgi:hypothetical protein
MAIPFCLVLGVDTSVTTAVARLTFPLARPPRKRARTKIAKVEAKHLKEEFFYHLIKRLSFLAHLNFRDIIKFTIVGYVAN